MKIKKMLSATTALTLAAALCVSFAGCGEKRKRINIR